MRVGVSVRGVPALLQAPLVILVALLATCNLNLRLNEPSLEIVAEAAYASAGNILVLYKVTTDEAVLRCRYLVTKDGEEIFNGVTGSLTSGEWHDLLLLLPDPIENGRYELRIVIQAERGGGFVDLAFLDETKSFYIDDQAPVEPPTPAGTPTFSAGYIHVYLSHPELTAPQASPVNIHYTLNNMIPAISSTTYNPATGIVRPVSDFNLPLKAAAFDLAGHSGPVYEQIPLFEDTVPPVLPSVDLDDALRFKYSKSVTVTHPEVSNPSGSPVSIYYSVDGTTWHLFEDTCQLPFNVGSVTLQCFAQDGAGNQSGILTKNYKFTAITHTDPTPLVSGRGFVPIKVFGFGFVGVLNSNISMEDSLGNTVDLFYNTIQEDYLYFAANLTVSALGDATIRITVPDAGPLIHELNYLIQ